jgi:hypothetical protein
MGNRKIGKIREREGEGGSESISTSLRAAGPPDPVLIFPIFL